MLCSLLTCVSDMTGRGHGSCLKREGTRIQRGETIRTAIQGTRALGQNSVDALLHIE